MRPPSLQTRILDALRDGTEKSGEEIRRACRLLSAPYGPLSILVKEKRVKRLKRRSGNLVKSYYQIA